MVVKREIERSAQIAWKHGAITAKSLKSLQIR